MTEKFESLTKTLTFYSKESFSDISEVMWNFIDKKPKILNQCDQNEFSLSDFAQKYYLFLLGEYQMSTNKKDFIKISDKEIDKFNTAINILKKDKSCFILNKNGTIKGFCNYVINNRKKEVYISKLFTVKEYQRQGIANKLLHYIEKKAILDYKCNTMNVLVFSKNFNAKAFYNNFGFKPINNKENHSQESNYEKH